MNPGLWIAASHALGRDVTTNEPYPHICNLDVVGRVTQPPVRYRLWRRDCAACAEQAGRRAS